MVKSFSKFVIVLLMSIYAIESSAQCQYLEPQGIIDLQDSLTTHFPNICKKVTIGTSVTGYDITALKFSDNVNADESEPEVLLTFCIHGDENFPEQVGAKLSRKLCLDYNTDPQTTNLINNTEIWIVIVMNPDGLRGINDFHRPNANGIDLNRNFGYMWNAEDFDPHEYSEPETKAYRDFILSHNFNLLIDYHAGLQGIIYPWYYKDGNTPDNAEIEYLANQYKTNSGYPADAFNVTTGYNLYPTNGSLVEFAYGSLGIYAYAVELNAFPNMEYDACQLYTMNKPAIFKLIEKSGKGFSGIIKDANSGNPIQAKITVQGKLPFYSSTKGDYHKFLKSGTYSVTVSANGYTDKTKTITIDETSLLTEDFQLTPANNYSAQKILTCRNFDNYADPAETWNALGINDGNYYAIGDTGYVVLDMGLAVTDVSGNDITVHGDASGTGDAFELFYSNTIDGPWTSLGTGTSTKSFDLNGVNNARYFRIKDNGAGPGNVAGAGFHLDALTAVKINVGIDQEAFLNNDITAYPNPAVDVIHFKGNKTSQIENISLYNMSGKLLVQKDYSDKLNISNLKAGIYFIKLYSDNSTITLKIIKK